MLNRLVVSFCGYPGAGKDEAGLILANEYGFTKRSFGEFVRMEAHTAFTDEEYRLNVWDRLPLALQLAFTVCAQSGDIDPWSKPTSDTMRIVLQLWGTEFRRKQDPDHWVDHERQEVPAEGRLYYTDIRFPNEFHFQRGMGGYLFHIANPRAKKLDHESEWHWPHFVRDGLIENYGGLMEFHDNVRMAMNSLLKSVGPTVGRL